MPIRKPALCGLFHARGGGGEKSRGPKPETDRLGAFLCAQVLEIFFCLLMRRGTPQPGCADLCIRQHKPLSTTSWWTTWPRLLRARCKADHLHPENPAWCGIFSPGELESVDFVDFVDGVERRWAKEKGQIKEVDDSSTSYTAMNKENSGGGFDGGNDARMPRKPSPVLDSVRTPSPPADRFSKPSKVQ